VTETKHYKKKLKKTSYLKVKTIIT